MPDDTVHGSAVAVDGRGVLIRGASGAGKSSLALSILHAERERAALVADDRVVVERNVDGLTMRPPEALAGLIEIRGQGIVRLPHAGGTSLHLVVDLLPAEECPRFPGPEDRRIGLLGVTVARIFIACDASSGAARVAFALSTLENPAESGS